MELEIVCKAFIMGFMPCYSKLSLFLINMALYKLDGKLLI